MKEFHPCSCTLAAIGSPLPVSADNELAVDLNTGRHISSIPSLMCWNTNASSTCAEARYPGYPTHSCSDHGRGIRLARDAPHETLLGTDSTRKGNA